MTSEQQNWIRSKRIAIVLCFALLAAPALSTSARAPLTRTVHQGPGNQVTLGSRESGFYLEYTISGVELGEVSYQGYGNHYTEGTVTSSVVQIQGILYNAMGPNLVTRPSMMAKLGSSNQDCSNGGIVSWPPEELLDAEGFMSGPFEQELPFSFSYQPQPGDPWVCFSVQVGKNGGVYEGLAVSGWARWDPEKLPTAQDTPAPTSLPASPTFKPPCEEPLFFYPNQDFSSFYTSQPSLNYSRDEMVNDLLRGLQRYAAGPGAKLEDGALPWDVANIAMTFTSDSTLPEGKQAAPALQTAARDLARAKQASAPDYRVSPGELLELSLKLNNGNVRNALVTCHAALYRDSEGVNKSFVEQENILTPLRNPEGYADAEWTYTTPVGSKRTVNPKAIAQDQQGPWYHLYGMAALEYTDGYNAASFYGAQVGIWAIGDTSKRDAMQKIRDKGMPITGLGGVLGDLANALEEGIRSQAGAPPDIDKNCINYTGLKAGHEIRRLVNSPELVSPPPDDYTPGGQFRQDTDRVITLGKHVVYRSPLSLWIEGTNGEWFTFDQISQQFDGDTPLVVFDFFGEEDGSIGLVAQPLFEVSSMQMTATGPGSVELAIYDPDSGRAEAYQLTVQPGDLIYVPGGDEPILLNGSSLSPAASAEPHRSLPLLWLLILGGGAVGLALLGVVVVLLSRSRTAGHARPSQAKASGAPAPAPQVYCPHCGQAVRPGTKFCEACGGPLALATLSPAQRVSPHHTQGETGWQLLIVDGPGAGQRYVLGRNTSLGRSPDNSIQLNDTQSSRHHALFQQAGGGYVLEDLGSTNGTLVNGQHIRGPIAVKPGDRVQMGTTVMQVIRGE